jgi:hypothetical protein
MWPKDFSFNRGQQAAEEVGVRLPVGSKEHADPGLGVAVEVGCGDRSLSPASMISFRAFDRISQ